MIVWVSAKGDRALIRNRAPLLLSGRTFTSQEIEDLRETVRMFPRLSWGELVRAVERVCAELVADFRAVLQGRAVEAGRSDEQVKPKRATRSRETSTQMREAGPPTGGARVARTSGRTGAEESAPSHPA
jgi:hypothetical protein